MAGKWNLRLEVIDISRMARHVPAARLPWVGSRHPDRRLPMMTKSTPERALAALALSTTVLLGACAQTEQVSDVTPVGGFLPQPALLEPGKTGEVALVYRDPNANWASYRKMILDPVTIWTGPGSDLSSVPPEQRKALADSLYTHLHDAAAQRCQMVTEPSPDTIRIRVALVGAEPSNAVLNTISTYVPQAHVLSAMTGAAFNDGVGFFAGTASVEGYALDATNGQLLWQGVDERGGGNALGTNTFDSWNDVDNAFKAWGEQFTTRLVDLGACPT
jgi:hypothetical protein